MECLQEIESTFRYGKELQKQSAVVAVKLREVKASVYLTLGKQGRGGRRRKMKYCLEND